MNTGIIRPQARFHINCWLDHDGLYGCIYDIKAIRVPTSDAAKGVYIEWEGDTFYASGIEDSGDTVFIDIYADYYGKKLGGEYSEYRIANLSDDYRHRNSKMHY